ncbi:MAG: uroporphyrinogen decarboxylase family protein [Planctomycetota bacterium]
MDFEPDYRHITTAANNKRPSRLPVYEHYISPLIMEKALGKSFAALESGGDCDLREFFINFCRFFKEMTYDTVSYEFCITEILPDHGAIMGGRPGPIQNRRDFESYPWDELPQMYWQKAEKKFDMLCECLPAGMKALGGIGNGILEISEDLVGFEYLSYMQADNPELFAQLYCRIGDLMVTIWTYFLHRYAEHFCVCRVGDDLGHKTATLLAPNTIVTHIVRQYHRVISLIHKAKRPFLWHSCGNIFEVMEPVIKAGIDCKHSNEDVIAPFEEWINRYGRRIGLFGGIDVDVLCTNTPDEIYEKVLDKGRLYRNTANGYALGSGNSIPDYVPLEGYLAMLRAAQQIRVNEEKLGTHL